MRDGIYRSSIYGQSIVFSLEGKISVTKVSRLYQPRNRFYDLWTGPAPKRPLYEEFSAYPIGIGTGI